MKLNSDFQSYTRKYAEKLLRKQQQTTEIHGIHTNKRKQKEQKRHYYEFSTKLSSILVHEWLPFKTFTLSLF